MRLFTMLRHKKDEELEVVLTAPEAPEERDANPLDLTKIAARGLESTMAVGAIEAATLSVGAIQTTAETLAQAPPAAEAEALEDTILPLAGLDPGQPGDGSPADVSDGNRTVAGLVPLLGIFEEEGVVDENLADLVTRVEDVSAIDLLDELRELSQSFGIN